MSKNKISEWSSTPANNTDVGGIDIAEGCAPSGINNAIREMMAQVKDMITGADGDSQVIGGNLTVNGTTTLNVDLPIASGGTGASTAADARTNLGLGTIATQAANNVAITGGSVTGITDLAVADGGTGASTAADARTNLGITATGADTTYAFRANNLSDLASASTARNNLGLGSIATQNSNSVSISGGSITGITDLAVADGGTGHSSLTANNLIMGNGTNAVAFVAPSTSGNVLTSNGTTWTSAAPAPAIGVGQTWTDVTGSRAIGTTYTNSTGMPIQVSISVQSQTAVGCYVRFYINGSVVARQGSSQNDSADVRANVSLIVPNGNTYKIENADQAGNNGQGQIIIQTWWELR